MQCLRCQHQNAAREKFCGQCGTPFLALGELQPSYADLQRSLTEALEQQTATADILRVIGASPGNVQPVFDAIARSCVKLGQGVFGGVFRFDGQLIHLAAHHNWPPEALERYRQTFPRPPGTDNVITRTVLQQSLVHVPDITTDGSLALSQDLSRLIRYRSALAVPMLRDGRVVGVVAVARDEPGAFSESQIALLQTFADQAVIAVENVRLFNETKEALEQQTATSEILRVIASSPTDLRPVLDTVVKSAARFCGADDVTIFQLDQEELRLAAHHGPLPSRLGNRVQVVPGSVVGRSVLERRAVHAPDVQTDLEEFPEASAVARKVGYRTQLSVPLLREGAAVGALQLRRANVEPFNEKQISLLQIFADQAVIAIENVRLFTELQEKNRALTQAHGQVTEALDQQTATSEILRVISSSPNDVQPVFDIIVESAVGLCKGFFGAVFRYERDVVSVVAECNVPQQGLEALRRIYPGPPAPATAPGRAILTRTVVHIHDQANNEEFTPTIARASGFRTNIAVPMLRDGQPIGAIAVARREVLPFSEAEIELLKTFADQAVIAIENVRLFTQLQDKNRALTQAHAHVTEALDQQTATSEILRVIGRSPTDAQPVFDTIAESAVNVCAAFACAVFVVDGDMLRVAATHGVPLKRLERFRQEYPVPLDSEIDSAKTTRMRRLFHLADIEHNPTASPGDVENARLGGYQTRLMVPMVRGDRALGLIAVTREAPAPFSDQQVDLLKTFADQAVIAIENVRLFTELQEKNRALTEAHATVTESLERQTATSEILRVISSSPTDTQPVFDAIARNAVALCGGIAALVLRYDGEMLHIAGHHEMSPDAVERVERAFPRRPGRDYPPGRALLERHVVHIPDLQAATEFTASTARQRGVGSMLVVPLLREGQAIGVISLARDVVGPFSAQQIEVLETFADQAVIAIENVRLFTELQEKNRALTQSHGQVTEALEQQTATSEILRVISSSPTDVQPVFDAIVRSASRLCGGEYAIVTRYDGQLLQLAAQYNPRPGTADETARFFPLAPRREASLTPRAFVDARMVHVPDVDVAEDLEPSTREFYRRIGLHAALAMPMIHEGRPIGVVSVSRGSPGPFSDRQIALLQTFADQAVIAIENVRLFKELQTSNRDLTTALDQQTATSEVLRAITHAPTDTQPVFDTIVRNAVRLCNGFFGIVTRYDGHTINVVAKHNLSAEALELVRKAHARPGSMTAQALASRAVVHVHDAMSAAELSAAVAKSAGYRTIISVPMLREGQPIGTINVSRRELRPFSDTEIDLLKTFADQAVIAIENVRLFTELQARTAELTRSVDELTALGEVSRALSATLDVDVVLDTIVARANDLIGADGCTIFEYDEATEQFHLRATRNLEPGLVELARGTPLRRGDQGILGRLPSERQAIQVPDITVGSYSSPISDALIEAGYRAVVAVPLVREDHLIGALTMNRKTPGEFPLHTIQLLQTFATQSALAIQNARLFREIADKSRQLEVASQHKSEFLANMSHELRTPLNAIIGFSEVLSDRMFGDLNEKQEEYLKDIHASGTHLLSLINDILDLSKIEAGRMELELTEFDLPTAIENALMLVRERAGRRSIALHTNIDNRLGQIQADERKIRQVVLNLLSNAIKFTPEGGRIEVAAVPKNGFVEVSVSDTGVGVAPEDQEAIFEEFRQVGTAEKKAEGTGLGLTLCRKFIELHGGRIWVKSQVGAGSTFTFTIPVRHGE